MYRKLRHRHVVAYLDSYFDTSTFQLYIFLVGPSSCLAAWIGAGELAVRSIYFMRFVPLVSPLLCMCCVCTTAVLVGPGIVPRRTDWSRGTGRVARFTHCD
jgi:hypothetical protein